MLDQLGYLAESDLDLLLVLDAYLGGPLTQLLLAKVGAPTGVKLTARRSTLRCAGTRETDVELSWDSGVVFVEDKVNARFTPGQPESCHQEVAERRSRHENAWSVLVCPLHLKSSYMAEAEDAFDAVVPCTELAEEAESAGDSFSRATAVVFRAGGGAEADGRR